MMQAPIACETRAWRSFGRLSGSQPWISTWISSWDPLKLCDAIRRTTSAPPGQNPGRARPRSAHSPLQSHHSNAPIKPVSQSNLSKIVALLTAIRARLPSVRIAPQLAGHSLLRSYRRAVPFALSGDPCEQTCRIQQGACLIEQPLHVESDFNALVL